MALGEVISKKNLSDVKFSYKTRPKKAIASIVLAVFSFLLMLTMIILSVIQRGAGELYLGIGGIDALVLSVIGFILALRCFKMEDIYYGTPVTGAVLNGILTLAWLAMYVKGIVG